MVKRGIYISIIAVSVLYGESVSDLGSIDVNATSSKAKKSVIKKRAKIKTKPPVMESISNDDIGNIDVTSSPSSITVNDVGGEEVRSADVANSLSKTVPGVNIIRRSAVANDIVVRGLKKDNISVTIDDSKLYGACPNRMDPPISHVLANNIDRIEIYEGPYDVTQSGALGASVKVYTKEPESGLNGAINLGLGRWNYRKLSGYLSGGNDKVKFELGLSTETSDQYEDGNGNSMSKQLDNYIKSHPALAGKAYQDRYKDMSAYTKSTLMGKIYWNITDNQELKLSYTANRSDNILYPSTPMDADYDNSDLFNSEYIIKNLGEYSKKLKFKYYKTKVDHPMSTRYRKIAVSPTNKMGIVKHQLQSEVEGGSIINEFVLGNNDIESGVDFSRRNWDGKYYMHDDMPFPKAKLHSIYDVDTDDYGIYIKDRYKISSLQIDSGFRFDHVEIDTPRAGDRDRTFDGIGANIMTHYTLNSNTTLFLGAGTAMRIPDGKELYFRSKTGAVVGNENLDPVRNYEVDLGAEFGYGNITSKIKGFYSYLQDNILYNSTLPNGVGKGKYENMDSYIYGAELSASYSYSDTLHFDTSVFWMEGKKKEPLTGQKDTDLPDIAPLNFKLGATWMPMDDLELKADFIASARWDKIDSDNGEQILGGWSVLNLKMTKSWGDSLEWIVGVDNLFDKSYAISNTYKDLTLVTGGSPMLMNEPGRYVYTNIRYKF